MSLIIGTVLLKLLTPTAGGSILTRRYRVQEASMNAQGDGRQAGIVLLLVLLMLTLFDLVGVVFVTFSAAERQCEQNPTVVMRDGSCTKEVGPKPRP